MFILVSKCLFFYLLKISSNSFTWRTYSRYREFEAFRQFILTELKDSELISKLPPFPPKSMGKLRGKALEDRKNALENYLSFLCSVGGYNALNVVDALSSFLEVIIYLFFFPVLLFITLKLKKNRSLNILKRFHLYQKHKQF